MKKYILMLAAMALFLPFMPSAIDAETFPNFPKKHQYESLITPKAFMDYHKTTGLYPQYSAPHTVIFCYYDRLFNHILQNYRHQQCNGILSKVYLLLDHPGVAIANYGMGAPFNVLKLEQCIVWGARNFISIGLAGGLQKDLAIGDIILCNKAIRDEGTSHHYVPNAKYAHASPVMQKKLAAALEKKHLTYRTGTTWTTDAFFRETKEEILHYQDEGVACVEMEAAAQFSVASLYDDVQFGAMFTISDNFADLEWNPSLEGEKAWKALNALFEAALDVASDQAV